MVEILNPNDLDSEIRPPSRFLYSFNEVDETIMSKIGGKGANLVRLKKAGLPVPAGFVVTTDVHDYFLENGRLPDGLVDEIIKAKQTLGGKVAIRSSANCEDGVQLSMAGVFKSDYVYEDGEVSNTVEEIFGQSRSSEVAQFMGIHSLLAEDVKMGLVIQELIEPEAAGVIYTGVNGDNALVQYVDGFGASLVDGKIQGSAMLVSSDGMILESTGFESRPLTAAVVSQISQHSRSIEDLFPGAPQDIEFAYRDGTVHIVQARTLTTDLGAVELEETPEECLEATKRKLRGLVAEEKQELGTKTAIFSDANYSELLPRPTEMDIGVYMYVWGGSDGIPGAKQLGHAEMGYRIGDEAIGVINYIGGRTYFSIGRMAALYNIGFPETAEEYFLTLGNEYLDAVQDDPQKGAYPQMGLYLQDPTLEDLQVRFGDRAEEYFQIYQDFVPRMRSHADRYLSEFYQHRLPEMTDYVKAMQAVELVDMTNEQLLTHGIGILEHVRTYSFVDFVNAARLGLYYSKRLQDLLMQRLGVGVDQAQEMYSRLNQGLDGSAITDANIAISEAATEADAIDVAKSLIRHFNTGEMFEIRHKPLRDVPDALEAYVRGIRQTDYKNQFERQKEARIQAQESLLTTLPDEERGELETVIRSSQTYMALRETIKYLFTKEYLLFRDTLEVLEDRLALAESDIYFLYPRELPDLISDPDSMRHLINSRRQSFLNYEQLDLPHVIRESDIDSLSLRTESEEDFKEATGKFLASGEKVEGVIVNLDDFDGLDHANSTMKQYREQDVPIILVATQMNLSHDPFIAQAAGLVIENAGIVAHGAQRARELGKGAIGGIRSRQLKTGIKVFFDPATRTIRRIE